MVSSIFRNVRYALRVLSRTPAFSLTVIVTLALGIGANSAVFSALDAVVLRPLPFPNGERLMRVTQVRDDRPSLVAPVRIEDWNRLNSTFDGITSFFVEDVADTTGELPEMARRATVAPRFFDVWGIAPALGRGFNDADHRGTSPAVVVSDRYWRTRLAADPNVIEKQVRIGEVSRRIVGVMPASFLFPDRGTDLWVPEAIDTPLAQRRELAWYPGIGRLKPGVTIDAALADLAVVQAGLAETYPETDARISVAIEPFKNGIVAGARSSLWLLFAAGSLLLLIACTNVVTLLLTRGAERRREISVRLSLGASSSNVVAQWLTETAVLAAAGAGAGILVATAITGGLRALAGNVPRLDEVSLDGRMLLYTLGSVAAVTLLCGLLPALKAARGGLVANIASSTGARVSGRHSLHWSLAGVQVALSVALLVGAGLLLRSFQELSRVDAGFERDHILTFRLNSTFADAVSTSGFPQRVASMLEALRALPRVQAAATATFLPGVPTTFESEYEMPSAGASPNTRILAEERAASSSYFATLGIPLAQGALCRDSGDEVMVNQRFVDLYLGGAVTVGVGVRIVRNQPFPGSGTIVGVVGDSRERGLDRAPAPTVYFCANWANPNSFFLLRARGESSAIVQDVRLALKELEPLRAVYNIAPLDEQIDDAFADNRMRTVVLASFAVTALALACLGLFGTLSYVLSLRRREVGLRMAVGARPGDIAAQFVGKTLRVVAFACAVGLALSFAFARLLSGMLVGVSPTDLRTLVTVVAIVIVVGVLAALVPAVRAARIEPIRVLREE
jgi:putative ABC transport system permease protein